MLSRPRRPRFRQKPPQSPSLQAEVVIATSIAASHSVSRLTSSSSEKHRPQTPSALPILTSPTRRRRRSSPITDIVPKTEGEAPSTVVCSPLKSSCSPPSQLLRHLLPQPCVVVVQTRGIFGLPSAKKSEIESLVQQLESQNPTPDPNLELDKDEDMLKWIKG